MDQAPLREVRRACDRALAFITQIEGRLPESGEPAALYVARAQLGSDDIQTARIAAPSGRPVWVAFVKTAVDRARVYDEVLRPLQELARQGVPDPVAILPRAEPAGSQPAEKLAKGQVLITDGQTMWAVDMESFPRRAVAEATTEQAIIGSKQGFTEDLESNIGAIRSRLRDPSLRIELFEVGKRSHTQVALAYLADVVNPDVLELTRRGLAGIEADFVRASMEIQQSLYGKSLTTIPLAEQTERVDRAASAIANGRLCLIVSGTPFVLLVPTSFADTFMDTDTALPGPVTVSFVRILRMLGEVLAIAVPGLYAAVLTADTQLLPIPLALAVAASRSGVPYPVLTETLIMLIVIDVFSEATAQVPGGIGNALSIVGTLIIGEMAVQAHLASSLMMIVVAVSALGQFLAIKYHYSYTLRLWKYPVAILGGIGGLFGWLAGLLLLLSHMALLKSAGVPYLAPFGPYRPRTALRNTLTLASPPFRRRRPNVANQQQLDDAGPAPS